MFGRRRPILTTNDGPVARFEGVGLRYGRDGEALQDVSFSLDAGRFYFLTGPSGAGKSSLLKLLYLALRPTSGFVSLFGADVSAVDRSSLPDLRRRIGVVFQDFRLLDHLSAFENVALPLRVQGHPPESYAEDIQELLRWVGLGDRLDASPSSLSGGEQQRVAIARAVVAKPDLLIADEPTGNVDPEMGTRLIRLFLELNRLGTTVVIATHDIELVKRSGAPVLRLEAGRLLGPPVARPTDDLP